MGSPWPSTTATVGRSAYLASVPAGRMGTTKDIAHAVSFFASEAAGFITSQRLVVDGAEAYATDGACMRERLPA
jgi:NAD(P)-dependent dehydrogenase (short-subunit alcohol dehydrogenase family)